MSTFRRQGYQSLTARLADDSASAFARMQQLIAMGVDSIETDRDLLDVIADEEDRRVPAERRDVLPVVMDAEQTLLWVPGVWNSTSEAAVRLFLWASPPGTSQRR